MKGKRRWVTLGVVSVLLVFSLSYVVVNAGSWIDAYPTTDEQIHALADIQPGLGTVMMEYGNRYSTMWFAAKNGNWGLAAYQLKEQREIQEVGETTRPARAPLLKAFEANYLDPIDAAIQAKDWKKFNAAWNNGVKGCNACHTGLGFSYIVYERPWKAPSPLKMKLPVTSTKQIGNNP